MDDKIGVFELATEGAPEIVADYVRDGWRIFELSRGISSKADFFDGVRSTLPLNPELQGNQSWDALSDSLWTGIDGLQDRRILILWPDAGQIVTNSPEDAEIAIGLR